MPRPDISEYLIHWAKGDSDQDAFNHLKSIIFNGVLRAGNGHIKGKYDCICFSEAPVDAFFRGAGRYRPFGIRVSKKWLFSQGGRPVIYQADSEFEGLPRRFRWRHVRYEPDLDPPIDFSWEREWRICINELVLPPEEVVILLPSSLWANKLEQEHLEIEEIRIYMDCMAYGEWAALGGAEPFHYIYNLINTSSE